MDNTFHNLKYPFIHNDMIEAYIIYDCKTYKNIINNNKLYKNRHKIPPTNTITFHYRKQCIKSKQHQTYCIHLNNYYGYDLNQNTHEDFNSAADYIK